MSTMSISIASLTNKRKFDDVHGLSSAPKRVRLSSGEEVSKTSLASQAKTTATINGHITRDVLEQLKKICQSIENKKHIVVVEKGPDGRVCHVENSKLANDLNIEDPNFVAKCQMIFRKNVECIRAIGNVPYDFFEPALRHCTPQQLQKFEANNPTMAGRSEALWKRHVMKDHAIAKVDGFESWKKMWSKKTEESGLKFQHCLDKFKQSSTLIASGIRKSLVIETLPLGTARGASKKGAFKIANSKPLLIAPRHKSRK